MAEFVDILYGVGMSENNMAYIEQAEVMNGEEEEKERCVYSALLYIVWRSVLQCKRTDTQFLLA